MDLPGSVSQGQGRHQELLQVTAFSIFLVDSCASVGLWKSDQKLRNCSFLGAGVSDRNAHQFVTWLLPGELIRQNLVLLCQLPRPLPHPPCTPLLTPPSPTPVRSFEGEIVGGKGWGGGGNFYFEEVLWKKYVDFLPSSWDILRLNLKKKCPIFNKFKE